MPSPIGLEHPSPAPQTRTRVRLSARTLTHLRGELDGAPGRRRRCHRSINRARPAPAAAAHAALGCPSGLGLPSGDLEVHPHPPVDPDDESQAPASLTAPATRVVYAYDDRPRVWGYGHRAELALMTDIDDVLADVDNGVADLNRRSSASHAARACQADCRGPRAVCTVERIRRGLRHGQ
jgi:hypothetical protein